MSALSNQALPTSALSGDPAATLLARAMLGLIGAGYQAPQSSLCAADFLALGSSVADVRAALLNVWNQEFVTGATSATGLLTQWEETLGLQTDETLSDADRRARLVAFVRSAIAGTPQAIESAVKALTGECTIVEFTAAEVWASDPTPTTATRRNVFRFVVVVPVGWVESTPKRNLIAQVVERMKPAHTSFVIAASRAAQFDLPNGYDLSAYGV